MLVQSSVFQNFSSAIALHMAHQLELLLEATGDDITPIISGWEAKCNTVKTSKRLRVDVIPFSSVKACFGALVSYHCSLCHIPGLVQRVRCSGVLQIPPETTSVTSGGTHTTA